jgi:hypothetical protein
MVGNQKHDNLIVSDELRGSTAKDIDAVRAFMRWFDIGI